MTPNGNKKRQQQNNDNNDNNDNNSRNNKKQIGSGKDYKLGSELMT